MTAHELPECMKMIFLRRLSAGKTFISFLYAWPACFCLSCMSTYIVDPAVGTYSYSLSVINLSMHAWSEFLSPGMFSSLPVGSCT